MTTIPEVPLSHAQAARELLLQIHAQRASIAGLTLLPNERLTELSNAASVSDKFLETVVVATGTTPDLASVARIDGPKVRDVIEFSRAYAAVAEEYELTARMIRHTITLRRAEVGQEALRTFAIAKDLNRPRKRDVLVPHIEAMRRALARGRRRPAAPDTPDQAT